MFQARSSCGRGSMTVLVMRLRAEFILITLMKWSYKVWAEVVGPLRCIKMCRWGLDKARSVILLQRQLTYVISDIGVVSAPSLMPSIAPSINPATFFLIQRCSIPTMELSGPSPAPYFSTSVDCGGYTLLNPSICYFSSCWGIQFRFRMTYFTFPNRNLCFTHPVEAKVWTRVSIVEVQSFSNSLQQKTPSVRSTLL